MNILLTCAGGPAAIGVIKSLNIINFLGKIVSVDSDKNSAGLYLSNKSYVVPNVTDSKYWKTVLNIILKEKINLILPTGDADILLFSKNKDVLEKHGVICYMSDYDTIHTCQDKKLFFEHCVRNFPMPKTSLNYKDITFPIFTKPRRGSGSRDIRICDNLNDIKSLKKLEYIFQEYLPGKEYTVDTLSNINGKFISCVIRERIQIKSGITTKTKIIKNSNMALLSKKLCEYLKIKGPSCIQFKLDSNNTPKLIELNPRLGGGTYFSSLAGMNSVELILKMIDNIHFTSPKIKKMTIVRYYEEIIV